MLWRTLLSFQPSSTISGLPSGLSSRSASGMKSRLGAQVAHTPPKPIVLKPRKLGFERDFPFQLENSRGKRLAFVDVGGLRILDPLDFKDQKVNVLGKLEALEKGSQELVIRARLLRRLD